MPANQQEIDHYWFTDLALPPDFQPKAGGIHVIAQELYDGVQLFQREDWLLIAAPALRVNQITERVRGVSVRQIFSREFVKRLLAPDVGVIIGPAHVGYADAATFLPSSEHGCRLLTPDDAAARQSLADALSAAELGQSGLDPNESPAFGSFADSMLCAVASYQVWGLCIAHVTVATRPERRRRGHARAAVSALAGHALAQGLVLQYRALAENGNSLATGRALGFQHYCSTIYARPAGA